MCKQLKLKLILEDLIKLLDSVEEFNWSNDLQNFQNKMEHIQNDQDINIVLSDLARIYGGMGSFSDLVLYSKGQVLIKDNQKLEKLRKDLFESIKQCRT